MRAQPDLPKVAVLFARTDSNYKRIPGCDVYDETRDARTFAGGLPVVAHPPCRAWGSLRHFAKPAPGEMDLAPWAVEQVRRCGGVLEHPAASRLWPACGLPESGRVYAWGGFTMAIDQDWFGHRAEKRTKLYIVGCTPAQVPAFPLRLEEPTHVVSPWSGLRAGMPGYRPQISKAEREHTPPLLAAWMVKLASRTLVGRSAAMVCNLQEHA